MKINLKKYKTIIKSISIITLICFLCCGCNVKDLTLNVDKISKNVKKEVEWDKDALIKANANDELMRTYGSIYIKDVIYDADEKVMEDIDIYIDEHDNIAYRKYKTKKEKDKNDAYYNIKMDDKWYIANENGDIGIGRILDDAGVSTIEDLSCIRLYKNDDMILGTDENIMEHYIDDNGDGVVKTCIGHNLTKDVSEHYKYYEEKIGIGNVVKIIYTYIYDVDTLAIKSIKTENVNEKGNTYFVENMELIFGDGILPIMKRIKDNKENIKTIDEIIAYNTYDSIIKKHNSVKASMEIEKDYSKLLTYEVYGDFRGIKSFKSWDYTVNTTYSLSYTHIKDANGNWYKTNNGKDISKDNIITQNEKYYYENYDPIQGIFNQKSILWDKNIAVRNVINGTTGHIIYETDKLTDILDGYRKSIVSDLDREISYIKADFIYDIDDYVINDIKIEVTDKNGSVDKRMLTIKMEYDIEAPEYSKALFYDKEFKLDYKKLVEANTEKNLLRKYKSITIKDTRYKNAMLKDKEIVLYKNADGDFMIQDDKGVVYIRDSAGFIYKKENKDIDIKTRVQNIKELDVYVRDAFDNNDIVSALYSDNDIKSIINEKEKIVVCYNDLGKGKLITTNDDKTIRVEYIYDIADKTVEEISYYVIDNGKMNLKYITKINKGDGKIDF